MPDRQFVAPFGTHAAPADWRLPGSLEIVPKMAWASFDGAAAAGSYKPCLRIISDSGHVACEAVSEVIVAAGASADVTWFPGVDEDAETSAGEPVGVTAETVFYDTVNAGTPLAMTTVLQSGVAYVLVVEGTWSLWNDVLNVGSPDAEAQFPDSHAGRVSWEVGLDADTLFAHPSSHPQSLGHTSVLTMSLDGGATYSHLEPVGGPYASPQAGHLYRYELTGQGHSLRVLLNDINPPDNYGQLRFTLQVPAGTGTGSGAGSLVPPADTTLDGDVLTVVSGVAAWEANAGAGISSLASPGGTIAVTNPAGPIADVDLPATGVAPGGYGDSSHVSQLTVDAAGRVTAAASVPIAGGSGTIGFEVGYTQITANVNIVDASEATATALITVGPFTFDGAPVLLTFFTPALVTDSVAASDLVTVTLWEGATQLGRLGSQRTATVSSGRAITGVTFQYRFTPSAGLHTYKICAFASAVTGPPAITAGAGGTGAYLPAFVRITKV